jgi:hypothetical protein
MNFVILGGSKGLGDAFAKGLPEKRGSSLDCFQEPSYEPDTE